MSDPGASTRTDLGVIAADLEALVLRLGGITTGLPVSPQADLMFLGEADMDFPTAARSILECILDDRLRPAIQELRALSAFGKAEPEGE